MSDSISDPTPPPRAHILVIGGTGQCGQIFIPKAIEAGYELTIFARTPSKLPENLRTGDTHCHIVQGEFTDVDAIQEALSTGATMLVSFAGPDFPLNKGMAISDFYKRLYPLLPGSSIKRCLILSTASYKVAEDKETFKWWFGVKIGIRVLGGSAYAEINELSKATAALPPEIEWTLFRVPTLDNGGVKEVRASHLGDGTDSMFLSRKSMIAWVLKEIDERKWIRGAPSISNPSFM